MSNYIAQCKRIPTTETTLLLTVSINANQRSGHHAIANWICHVLSDKYTVEYYNDGRDIPNKIYRSTNHDRAVVHSYERNTINTNHTLNFAVIRDPANWIASLLQLGSIKPDSFHERISRYVSLSIHPELNHINYNQWFMNEAYRRSICKLLDCAYTQNGLNEIPLFGSGSSFTKLRQQCRGQELEVLTRWRQLSSDNTECLWQLLSKYPLLCYIAKINFNMNIDIEKHEITTC